MNILFEDKNLIFCVKPAGVLSQSDGTKTDMTVLLNKYFEESGQMSSAFCVHRLDRETGGVMVYAKNSNAAAKLSSVISDGRFEKEYLAVIQGKPQENSGTYTDLLFKDSSKNKSFVVRRMRRGVKQAVLKYELLDFSEKNEVSLVRIRLKTGRTHQIRVQFSSRGTPLLGDGKYGSRVNNCSLALWSRKISFVNPFTSEVTEYSCPSPDEYPWNLFDF